MTQKVGIYSGAFDPVHTGHIAFALEAADNCGMDKVFFLVEPRPRHKQGVKAVEHRQKMVELAIQKHPKLGSINLHQNRFTVMDTLPVLLARFKSAQVYFLMGDDMLSRFTDSAWPHLNEFVEAVQLVIGVRQGREQDVNGRIQTIEQTRGIRIRYETFVSEQPAASSTMIRSRLRKGQRPDYIDDAVYDYICQKHLYAQVTET